MTEASQPEADASPAPAEFVSTAPETSAVQGAKSGPKRKKKSDRPQPWLGNIEAIAISIVTIVLFKYFVLEAYRIPTGSMQPTLFGNEETGIFDRVIVDKFSYHFRDPERFEIVVFKYPLESNKNFIKRIVGMPGEQMRLAGGDVFVKPKNATDWQVLRRPRPIQDAQLRRLTTGGDWLKLGDARAGWRVESGSDGDDIEALGSGRVAFPRANSTLQIGGSSAGAPGSIRDGYLDGYPEGMKSKISVRGKGSGVNDVSDVRVAAEIEATAGTEWVRLRIHEAARTFSFALPGPAAPDGAGARIEVSGLEPAYADTLTEATAEPALRLAADDAVRIEVQNLNDLLELRIDGDLVASLEVPPAPTQPRAYVDIAVEARDGARTRIDDVRIWRDIYYVDLNQKTTAWAIPDDSYVMLGDNSQDSSDGRDWTAARFQVVQGDDVDAGFRGNNRPWNARGNRAAVADGNPIEVATKDGENLIFFRDENGERHVFDDAEVAQLTAAPAPYVPRDLLRGRAVLVVWPFSIKHDVYRWKWVR